MWTLLTKGIPTPKQGEGGPIEVEGVETEVEVKVFIKVDLPFVGGARAKLVKKKPNIEFRTVPYIKIAGRICGRHTQAIQRPPLLAILSRRKTRKESIEEVQQGSLNFDDPLKKIPFMFHMLKKERF